MLNFDIAVPLPRDATFDNYIKYLLGRNRRAWNIITAIGVAWQASRNGDDMPHRVIVLLNSLLGWLPGMLKDPATGFRYDPEMNDKTMNSLQEMVCFVPRD